MIERYVDSLTGINNENYLRLTYQDYLSENPNSNFIMLDFQKFKDINDTFGHNVGDEYLKTFATILKTNFFDSIVVRLHGDEFAVLTKCTIEEINKRFDLCDKKIQLAVQEGRIPRLFAYNAGSCKAEHGINITKEKADYMMYHAKKNKERFQPFAKEVWAHKTAQDDFLNKVDDCLKENSFTYTSRRLYDINGKEKNIIQVYTKDCDGSSIFGNEGYELLRKNAKLLQIDIHNIQNIIENYNYIKDNIVINIDFTSLLSNDSLIEYLKLIKEVRNIDLEKIVFSIDIAGLEYNSYNSLIKSVNALKDLNLKVRLEKYDSKIGDVVWEECHVDYIKVANNYWKKAMHNPKLAFSLKYKMDMINNYSDKTTAIFEAIENKEEIEFLKSIAPEDTLFSGNYYSGEKVLKLKK